MKVAVLAANGKAGSLIVKEAKNRGFEVSAFVRGGSERLGGIENLKIINKDIFSLTQGDLSEFDCIIDAFGEWENLALHKKHLEYLSGILRGSKAHLLIVGGAGSLYMDKNHSTILMDLADFPKEYKPVASATKEGLDFIRGADLNWTYVSPPAIFEADGVKSGFMIGTDEFFTNQNNESRGSYADFAQALVSLIGEHSRFKTRVSVVSK